MPQRTQVSQPAARAHRGRALAPRVQRGSAKEGAERTDTRRLRQAVKVTPDSISTRYSKRGNAAGRSPVARTRAGYLKR